MSRAVVIIAAVAMIGAIAGIVANYGS